jgi:predicted small metal-binding protein
MVLRRRLTPQRLGQLIAAHRSGVLEHEVGEEDAALPARKPLLQTTPAQLDHEVPTELDIGVRRALQPRSNLCANIRERPGANNRSSSIMARQITCECGQVVRGETEHELVEQTLEHLRRDHPQLVGKVTREDIVAMIEIVD